MSRRFDPPMFAPDKIENSRTFIARLRSCKRDLGRLLGFALLSFIVPSSSLWLPLHERFTADERRQFEAVVRPMVESSELPETDRMAYLTALTPS